MFTFKRELRLRGRGGACQLKPSPDKTQAVLAASDEGAPGCLPPPSPARRVPVGGGIQACSSHTFSSPLSTGMRNRTSWQSALVEI